MCEKISLTLEQYASIAEAADAMECAEKEAIDYIPSGSCTPEWIVRIHESARQMRALIAKQGLKADLV